MINENNSLPEGLTKAEEELLRALRLSGDLAPETAQEVTAAEGVWEAVDETDLPEPLKNPAALAAKIISDPADRIVDIAPSVVQREIEEELARAARFGNKISREIASRMKHDKQHARGKLKKSAP